MEGAKAQHAGAGICTQGAMLQEGPELHGDGPDQFEDIAAAHFQERVLVMCTQGAMLQEGPDLHGDGPDQFEDTAAVLFQGRWWIFVSVRTTAKSLLGFSRFHHGHTITIGGSMPDMGRDGHLFGEGKSRR